MENCSEKLGRNDLRERSRFDFNRDANSVGNLGVKVNLDISSKAYDQRVSNAPICAFKLRFFSPPSSNRINTYRMAIRKVSRSSSPNVGMH